MVAKKASDKEHKPGLKRAPSGGVKNKIAPSSAATRKARERSTETTAARKSTRGTNTMDAPVRHKSGPAKKRQTARSKDQLSLSVRQYADQEEALTKLASANFHSRNAQLMLIIREYFDMLDAGTVGRPRAAHREATPINTRPNFQIRDSEHIIKRVRATASAFEFSISGFVSAVFDEFMRRNGGAT